MKFMVSLAAGAALFCNLPAAIADNGVAGQLNAGTCAALKASLVLPEGVSLTSVKAVTSVSALESQLQPAQAKAFVPYCQITGEFEKRKGVKGKDYAIGFGLNLPFDWNGRFLFQGGGGLNGLIREPLGALAAGDTPALFRGFAVASTDSGHQSDTVFDPLFFEDQQALLNFYSGAVSKTAKLVSQLITGVYSQPAQTNYFVGCSTGGREAMTMSQRFPDLFDGIIAGAPARQTNYSEIADLYVAKTLRALSGNNQPPFSDKKQKAIEQALLAQCDGLDGREDGLIFAVEQCGFDPGKMICDGQQHSDSCLTTEEAEGLVTAFNGPVDSNGNNVYPGFFFDTGIDDKPARSAPGLLSAQPGPLGRARIDEPFDIDRELAIADGFPLEPGNATLTNLSTFVVEENKLMFFHGVSDPWFSAKDTLGYFKDMVAQNGGEEQVSQWSQFYFVPGMGHCRGGEQALDQFDMLTSLVDWVEKGDKPDSVVAWGESMPEEPRPLCPYPSVTTYKGEGDVSDADSYVCKTPESH